MAIAILDLDAETLPDGLALPARYSHALILTRWRRRPVGLTTVPLAAGRASGPLLRELVVSDAHAAILDRWLYDYLNVDDRPAVTTAPAATVAICTRDRPDDLLRCLSAVSSLPDDGQEILVVDSASRTDATREVVARFPAVRYYREPLPGLNRARNRALREARHPIVAFTDDDAMVEPEWLRSIARHFGDRRTLAATGLVLPLELETEAQEWFEWTNSFSRGLTPRFYDGSGYDPFLVGRIGAGANMALRRDVLELVGPFHEALDAGTASQSGGDHDIFNRILAAGYVIRYDPEALSWHRHRRDWAGLRQTLAGYGTGVYAYLTCQLIERGELRAPMIALSWLRTQIPNLIGAALRRPGRPPLDLVLAELGGCLRGPGAFFKARRQLRRELAER